MHHLEIELFDFDSNFTQFIPIGSVDKSLVITGSTNQWLDAYSVHYQHIIWTDAEPVHWHLYAYRWKVNYFDT